MRTNGIWSALLVTFLFIAVVGASLLALFHYTNSQFVLGVFGVATAIITASFQYRAAKDKETDARLFSQKQAAYSELIGTIMGLFHKKGTEPTAEEQTEFVRRLQSSRTQLLIWGSAATLRSVDGMSSIEANTATSTAASGVKWMAELFAAIRKDLGHKDPDGAALEMALGMLTEPDRSSMRTLIKKS